LKISRETAKMYKSKPIIVPKDYVMPREQELAFEILNKSILLNQILQLRMLSDKMKSSLDVTVLKDNLELAIIDFSKELNHLDKAETEEKEVVAKTEK